jgi:hypothetical protein
VALLAYLAFFSTYRYGRPFLTNAPEVFWLFVPFFALLFWRPSSFASRVALTINDSTFGLRARRAHALRIRPERSDCAIDEAARARRRTGPIGAPA